MGWVEWGTLGMFEVLVPAATARAQVTQLKAGQAVLLGDEGSAKLSCLLALLRCHSISHGEVKAGPC